MSLDTGPASLLLSYACSIPVRWHALVPDLTLTCLSWPGSPVSPSGMPARRRNRGRDDRRGGGTAGARRRPSGPASRSSRKARNAGGGSSPRLRLPAGSAPLLRGSAQRPRASPRGEREPLPLLCGEMLCDLLHTLRPDHGIHLVTERLIMCPVKHQRPGWPGRIGLNDPWPR